LFITSFHHSLDLGLCMLSASSFLKKIIFICYFHFLLWPVKVIFLTCLLPYFTKYYIESSETLS
jgi:hypothetical protein